MYQYIYRTRLPNKPYIYEHNALTLNLQQDMRKDKRNLLLTIPEIILEELRTTRNNCYKEGVQPSKVSSKNRINKNITIILKAHYKQHLNMGTLNIFNSKFGIGQALCTLDHNQKLIINLPP